jgi:type II secretory pathway pseudopilin PulG
MVVIAIIGIVSAIAMPVYSSVKEKGKQTSCVSQLKQIYASLQLYAADYPGYKRMHDRVDVPDSAMRNPLLLLPYLGDKSLLYCPETPECAKPKLATSYTWTFLPPEDSAIYESAKLQMDDWFSGASPQYPIVHCLVHDEMHYFPKERDLAEELNPPFVIRLKIDGSISSGRFSIHRGKDVSRACR